ncbi:MAG: phosphoribosyltransferase family protein [Anaerolineales bacterium]|jgi:hypothetical protein|nr:phosphoribosyltransferase family protein [Anaerolineales bacterium]HJO34503.1 phosphoribosyltransferase family protein [Anaerolineales bacterium]
MAFTGTVPDASLTGRMSNPIRKELLRWGDVEQLVDELIPQFRHDIEAMVIVTRGGIVPGGLLAEALEVKDILTASVQFPPIDVDHKLLAWPEFLQFPHEDVIAGKRILVVDDVWASGRTITSVKDRILGAAGLPKLCVLHFNPARSLFGQTRPDYYGAVTNAYIVYPWEIDRGADFALREPEMVS